MAGLAFAFAGNVPARLHFAWPVTSAPHGVLRNPRYRWVPPPPAIIPRLRGGRFVAPFVPFPGFLPPQFIRAGLAGGGWHGAAPAAHLPSSAWRDAPSATLALPPGWREADPLPRESRVPLQDATGQARIIRPVLGNATPQATECRARWTNVPLRTGLVAPAWRAGVGRAVDRRLLFVRAWLRRSEVLSAWRAGLVQGVAWRQSWRSAFPTGLAARLPWGEAARRGGLSWPWPPLPGLPLPVQRAALRFHFHGPTEAPLGFHFGAEPAWVIPIRRSYRMQHDLAFVRLPDRTPIPARALTLTSAWDEWGWSLTATLLGPNAVDLLRPVVSTPVEVEVLLDGGVWRFRLDQVSGTAEFGQTGGQTQGRSRAAVLGPDVALPTNGYEDQAKTARQLAEQELTGTDWQLDWPLEFPDWTVPAGTFRYEQKTPIEVIVQIVETAGGRLMADPALSWLYVTPKYPLPVWAWASAQPDVLLPRAILKTLAWKPRTGQPWDAVYLGDGATVLTKVKRAGLPGVSLPDSPIIEALLCHLDACRARGIALLSAAAAGVDFTLELPVSPAAGPSPLRAVGELARFEDGGKTWVGLITGVTVQVGFGTVTQTLEVRAVEVTS